MKELILVSFLVFIFSLFLVSALHSDTSVFEVDLLGEPDPIISISVPDSVFFGDLGKGEQSDEIRINITNTGTVGVIITPQLIDKSERIFNYTYFGRRLADPFRRIGNFTFNISAPALGDVRDDYIYAKLDLRNFLGDIEDNVPGYKADVRFFAVSI